MQRVVLVLALAFPGVVFAQQSYPNRPLRMAPYNQRDFMPAANVAQ
jgi:hypothetical protein